MSEEEQLLKTMKIIISGHHINYIGSRDESHVCFTKISADEHSLPESIWAVHALSPHELLW